MVDETQSNSRGSRYRLWSSYLVFNIVVFLSVVSVEIPYDQKIARRWSVAMSVISLILTGFTNYIHFNSIYRSIVLNTKIELYIISTLIVLWMVLVALVSSPTSGLAVENDGAVYLGNMYYFSWAGFINGVVLLASFAEDWFGISIRYSLQSYRNNNYNSTPITNPDNADNQIDTANNQYKAPSMAFIYWFSLMVSSIVVLGSSADIYNRTCQVEIDLKPQPFCSLTTFAIVTGSISTQISLLIIVGKLTHFTIPFLIELALCLLMFFLYCFELFYATRANGPGSPLGNLYYFSWISFLLCFGIGKCCYDDYVYALEVAGVEFEEGRMRRMNTNVPSLEDHDLEHGDGSLSLQQQQQQQQRYSYSVEMTTKESSGVAGGDGNGIENGNGNGNGNGNSDYNESDISQQPSVSTMKDNYHNGTGGNTAHVGNKDDRDREVDI